MVNLNKPPQGWENKEDITYNVLGITCIPKSKDEKTTQLEVRGEIFQSKFDFNEINDKARKKAKNYL